MKKMIALLMLTLSASAAMAQHHGYGHRNLHGHQGQHGHYARTRGWWLGLDSASRHWRPHCVSGHQATTPHCSATVGGLPTSACGHSAIGLQPFAKSNVYAMDRGSKFRWQHDTHQNLHSVKGR